MIFQIFKVGIRILLVPNLAYYKGCKLVNVNFLASTYTEVVFSVLFLIDEVVLTILATYVIDGHFEYCLFCLNFLNGEKIGNHQFSQDWNVILLAFSILFLVDIIEIPSTK